MTVDPDPPSFEGAGVVSSYADLHDALAQEHVDPAQVAFAAAGAGLDTLGVITNPLDSLFEAGIGWLIEHVEFLREPLDALAGDPGAVLDQARTWQGISAELHATAIGYRQATAVAGGWDGAAADAYVLAVHRCADAIDSTSRDAAELANIVVNTGAMVGTFRALIRDAVAKFLSNVIQWVIAAFATAAVTAGFSLGALVAAVVQDAVSLARKFVTKMSDLLDLLREAGTTAQQLGEALRSTAKELVDPAVVATHRRINELATNVVDDIVGPGVRAEAELLENAAKGAKAKTLIEAGKQGTTAEQEQRGWSGAD